MADAVPSTPERQKPPEPAPVAPAATSSEVVAQAAATQAEGLKREVASAAGQATSEQQQALEQAAQQALARAQEGESSPSAAPSTTTEEESQGWLAGIFSAAAPAIDGMKGVFANLNQMWKDVWASIKGFLGIGDGKDQEASELLYASAPIFNFPKGVSPVVGGRKMIRAVHPVTGEHNVPHNGVDITVPEGTPIIAAAELTVLESQQGDENGHFVKAQSPDGRLHFFLHLKEPGAKVGTKLAKGATIGLVGGTGGVSKRPDGTRAVHLHYEVHDSSNVVVDPEPFLASALRAQPEAGAQTAVADAEDGAPEGEDEAPAA